MGFRVPAGELRVALTLLVAAVLAGCAGQNTATGKIDGDGPTHVGSAIVDDTTGGIEGTIYDDELRPILDAEIAILGAAPPLITKSGEGGAFVFSKVAPGHHTLNAQRLGYHPETKTVDILAAKVSNLDFSLAPIAIPHPYVESVHHKGFMGIGIGYIRSAFCNECASNETSWFLFGGFPDDYKGMVMEAQWTTQDFLGFDLNQRGDDSKMWYRTRSQSPVHYFVEACGNYTGAPHFGRHDMPCAPEEITATQGADGAHLETWYIGQYQDLTHTFDPICQIPTPYWPAYQAGCYGLGAAVELTWETWLSFFHMELPDDAEHYSAFPEG